MRRITCTNLTDNVSLSFDDTFSPFVLLDVEGIYSVDVKVYSSENSLSDGSTVIGSVIKARNIVITVADKRNHPENRNFLYSLFRPNTEGQLVYYEKENSFEEKRQIDYVVENLSPESTGDARQSVISLICADPYFSDMEDTNVDMVSWGSQFEFEHEFTSLKEELGTMSIQKMVTVKNDSTSNVGMIITMEAEGTVRNPRMYHTQTDSYIQIGSDNVPFNMVYGDMIVISTVSNDKNAYLIRNGVQTSINEYIEEGSDYIQLIQGNNTLRYSAESGEENLLVSFSYRLKYLGV